MKRVDRGGRPRLTGTVVRIKLTLSLREGEHDDLLAWFEAIPPRQRARRILAALRQGGAVLRQAEEQEAADLLDDETFAAMLGAL
jgi:hypothetical protein